MTHSSWLEELFSKEVVTIATELDIADLNVTDDMTRAIAAGVNTLKNNKGNLQSQKDYLSTLEEGTRVLLCMWILDMQLQEKLQ